MRDLDIGDGNVNVNGGAISMGHPVGMSGARIALHLALELARRGGGLGAAGLCGGGGQGEALLLRVGRLSVNPTPPKTERTAHMADMNGQVALVTGGVRGIGLAISERLAARGVTVAAGYSRDKEAADKFCADHPGRQRPPGQHRLERGLRAGDPRGPRHPRPAGHPGQQRRHHRWTRPSAR